MTSYLAVDILGAMHVDEGLLYRELGTRIKERRVILGLTQAQLAEKSGISRASIAVIEAARQSSPLHVVYRLCAALGIEVAAVLPSNAQVTKREAPRLTISREALVSYPKAAAFLEESTRVLNEHGTDLIGKEPHDR